MWRIALHPRSDSFMVQSKWSSTVSNSWARIIQWRIKRRIVPLYLYIKFDTIASCCQKSTLNSDTTFEYQIKPFIFGLKERITSRNQPKSICLANKPCHFKCYTIRSKLLERLRREVNWVLVAKRRETAARVRKKHIAFEHSLIIKQPPTTSNAPLFYRQAEAPLSSTSASIRAANETFNQPLTFRRRPFSHLGAAKV